MTTDVQTQHQELVMLNTRKAALFIDGHYAIKCVSTFPKNRDLLISTLKANVKGLDDLDFQEVVLYNTELSNQQIDTLKQGYYHGCQGLIRHDNGLRHFHSELIKNGIKVRLGETQIIRDHGCGAPRLAQKQVDVQIAVDAMDALNRGVSSFLFICGDSDMIPIYKKLRIAGATVIIVYSSLAGAAESLRQQPMTVDLTKMTWVPPAQGIPTSWS